MFNTLKLLPFESQQNTFAVVQTFGTLPSDTSKFFEMWAIFRRLRAHMVFSWRSSLMPTQGQRESFHEGRLMPTQGHHESFYEGVLWCRHRANTNLLLRESLNADSGPAWSFSRGSPLIPNQGPHEAFHAFLAFAESSRAFWIRKRFAIRCWFFHARSAFLGVKVTDFCLGYFKQCRGPQVGFTLDHTSFVSM